MPASSKFKSFIGVLTNSWGWVERRGGKTVGAVQDAWAELKARHGALNSHHLFRGPHEAAIDSEKLGHETVANAYAQTSDRYKHSIKFARPEIQRGIKAERYKIKADYIAKTAGHSRYNPFRWPGLIAANVQKAARLSVNTFKMAWVPGVHARRQMLRAGLSVETAKYKSLKRVHGTTVKGHKVAIKADHARTEATRPHVGEIAATLLQKIFT